ncbi:hypothetical protein KEM55_006371, partial [Ascosphaera atra]
SMRPPSRSSRKLGINYKTMVDEVCNNRAATRAKASQHRAQQEDPQDDNPPLVGNMAQSQSGPANPVDTTDAATDPNQGPHDSAEGAPADASAEGAPADDSNATRAIQGNQASEEASPSNDREPADNELHGETNQLSQDCDDPEAAVESLLQEQETRHTQESLRQKEEIKTLRSQLASMSISASHTQLPQATMPSNNSEVDDLRRLVLTLQNKMESMNQATRRPRDDSSEDPLLQPPTCRPRRASPSQDSESSNLAPPLDVIDAIKLATRDRSHPAFALSLSQVADRRLNTARSVKRPEPCYLRVITLPTILTPGLINLTPSLSATGRFTSLNLSVSTTPLASLRMIFSSLCRAGRTKLLLRAPNLTKTSCTNFVI